MNTSFFSKLVAKFKQLPTIVKLLSIAFLLFAVVGAATTAAFVGFSVRAVQKNSKKSSELVAHREAPSPTPTSSKGKTAASAQKCPLPTKAVKESAFTIGIPEGWLYEFKNGTVSIMKDKSNTEGVFLYTAKLEKEISAEEFLNASSIFFTKAVAEEGGSFKVVDVQTSGNNASGKITASLNNIEITGLYKVEKEKDFITLKAYYAPTKDIEKSKPTLEQITNCFERTTVLTDDILTASKNSKAAEDNPAGFTQYKGRYFKLLLPTSFKVTGESDSGIDMSRNDMAAGFSYAYVTGAKGPYTPQSWVQFALPKFAKIQNLKLSAGRNVTSKVPGMTVQEFDFTGILSGTISVKGKTTAGVMNTTDYGMGSSTSAFWAIQIAKPEVWDSVKDKLQ